MMVYEDSSNVEVGIHTVTVAKSTPDPGKKFS